MANQSFGEFLRELRDQQGISLRGLATAADMDPAYLSRIENGKSGAPKPETVEKLGEALCETQQLKDEDCQRLKTRLLIAAGHRQDKEDLLDDLEDRFAARLRDQGLDDRQIDSALRQVSLPTMRAVLLGKEPLQIESSPNFSLTELVSRVELDEQVVDLSEGPNASMSIDSSPLRDAQMPARSGKDSASDYIARHTDDFAARRRMRRAEAKRPPSRKIRAGQDAVIHVTKELNKEQERQLRLLAKLIDSILQEK